MKLYLSSYKIGNKARVLKKWIKKNGNKIIMITNARDVYQDLDERKIRIARDVKMLENIGFDVNTVCLKKYFDNKEALQKDFYGYKSFFVIGGNVFALRDAMILSGFDYYIRNVKENDDYLYAGYSAGICVLSRSLEGLDLAEDSYSTLNNAKKDYKGLGIIDFLPLPHYKSDHPESENISFVAEYLKKKGLRYKTLKDGQVMIMNIEK